jgi:hypothetical protein
MNTFYKFLQLTDWCAQEIEANEWTIYQHAWHKQAEDGLEKIMSCLEFQINQAYDADLFFSIRVPSTRSPKSLLCPQ